MTSWASVTTFWVVVILSRVVKGVSWGRVRGASLLTTVSVGDSGSSSSSSSASASSAASTASKAVVEEKKPEPEPEEEEEDASGLLDFF